MSVRSEIFLSPFFNIQDGMYRQNKVPAENAGFVTWNSEVYPGLSLDNVPKAYHDMAENLLVGIDDPQGFFRDLESKRKDVAALDASPVIETIREIIREGDRSGMDSPRYRALKEKLYLHVIHTSLFMENSEENFSMGREKKYAVVASKIRRIEGLLKELD